MLQDPVLQGDSLTGDGGANVLDLGLVGTEMVYFAVGELGLDGGIMVTASHNPKEYTGMKIVRRGALPVGGESGLLDVRDRALAPHVGGQTPGQVRKEDVYPGFVDTAMMARYAAYRDGMERQIPAGRALTNLLLELGLLGFLTLALAVAIYMVRRGRPEEAHEAKPPEVDPSATLPV